jgi:hypothetical protein
MKRGSDGYGARRDRSWGPKILLFDNGSPAISRQERRIRRSCEGRLVGSPWGINTGHSLDRASSAPRLLRC